MKPRQQVLFFCTLFLLSIVFSACPRYGYKYSTTSIPDSPVNFEDINSEYDDYNVSAPFIRDVFPLVFSSNRLSKGGQMDFVFKLMALDFSKETGELNFYNETNNNMSETIRHNTIQFLLNQVNSNGNEFGPYIRSFYYDLYNSGATWDDENKFILLYASDKTNNLNIYYIHNRYGEVVHKPVSMINSEANEAYPSFNQDFSKLYFCNDQTGNFDIYFTNWDNTVSIEESLEDQEPKNIFPENRLNTPYNDKCPYIDGDYMVFASDRPGGFGGYDLYFSKKVGGSWQEPTNFGDKINSSFDEYRPILRLQYEFKNHLLIFSSDRPGGMGGFDLYYVGIYL
jgi:hypothetical protein